MLRLVVHSAQQHILERHILALAKRYRPPPLQRRRDVPLLRNRHDLPPHRVIRRIQAQRQLWPHRFLGKPPDRRLNPAGGHRHPRLRNPHSAQHMHALHKRVVVQKRLAHPHKHQVDPADLSSSRRLSPFAAPNPHSLPVQHRRHLPRNLARRQIPPHPQLRRQTKLAIHRTPHLARHTNRRPLIPTRLLFVIPAGTLLLAFTFVILTRRVRISVFALRQTGWPLFPVPCRGPRRAVLARWGDCRGPRRAVLARWGD